MGLKSLFVFLAASALCASASAQTTKWTIGWTNAVGSSYAETVKLVPARIEAATKGRLKIELYDTLVAGAEQPAAVRDGRLDGSFAVSPWLSAEAPLINFGALPGLLTDLPTYHKMLDPLLRNEVAKVWATKYGARQLATGVFEEQCVISKTPIRTMADFAGKKTRVHNTEAAALISKIGGVPTPVPFGEITTSLQRGIVDVVMTSVGTANGFGFPSVAKQLSIWRIGPIVTWSFVVNEAVWNKLPADLKPIVEAEFRRIEDEHFARSAAFSKESIDRLVKAGMTLYEAPPEELNKLFAPANVSSVYENWYQLNEKAGTDGRALVKKINDMKAKM
ncbi:MAG: TRAP-type C4-dicarboxylate transport system, substrate-binding protein [Rhizobacter sp.]|nr:TRAP-type C4-dicarboxylate transport system, substrate-binding protein [Rhizobacter sp.]